MNRFIRRLGIVAVLACTYAAAALAAPEAPVLAEAGTDAVFAGLSGKSPALERFGLRGYGAHSNDSEYVLIDSIEPRLYLMTRMIMDVSQGKDRATK